MRCAEDRAVVWFCPNLLDDLGQVPSPPWASISCSSHQETRLGDLSESSKLYALDSSKFYALGVLSLTPGCPQAGMILEGHF